MRRRAPRTLHFVGVAALVLLMPDGRCLNVTLRAGDMFVQEPIVSHSIEHTGDNECRIALIERKYSPQP